MIGLGCIRKEASIIVLAQQELGVFVSLGLGTISPHGKRSGPLARD
jgi:hypothetical protein